MPLAGFEPGTPACNRAQILALDRSATGIGRGSIPGHAACGMSLYLLTYPDIRCSFSPKEKCSVFKIAELCAGKARPVLKYDTKCQRARFTLAQENFI